MHRTAFVWSDDYYKYSFPDDHPFKSLRESMAKRYLEDRGAFHYIDIVSPQLVSDDILQIVHSREYIEFVRKKSLEGIGYLDEGDTPAFKGIYEASLVRISGSVTALNLLLNGEYEHTINIGGGFHHAKRNKAGGFCVFNDVALVAKLAENKLSKIAIVDIDGHHGDGTQELLYDDDKVLKISLHMYHPNFFPGSGSVNEIGTGKASGYTVNVPLPPGTGDDGYLLAFNEVVVPILERYKPEVIILMEGGDSHFDDPLVELKLSTYGYLDVVTKVHNIAHRYAGGKLLMLGGGGYNYDATARTWVLSIAQIADIYDAEYELLHDQYHTKSSSFVMDRIKYIISQLKKIHSLD
ncbi:acetoin utilization protein AcuC [Sulfolobus sp. F3]|nr:acetoin utilization protein AcuC [Sulfolobus sp. F3]